MDNRRASWQLKRQDDHGNKTVMEEFSSSEAAEKQMNYYQSKGHKQTYWVEECKEG